jgi:hypothetical protein
LELGFGYGRVIRWLRSENLSKKILAVDHCARFYHFVKTLLGHTPGITLLECKISDFQVQVNVDLVLWMWAGILEVDDKTKMNTLRMLSDRVQPKCKVIIEMPDEIIGHEIIEENEGTTMKVVTAFGKLNIFRITRGNLIAMVEDVNFFLLKEIPYATPTKIPRRIFIFEKR